MSPLVSVVIPVFNGSDFLACAIESALAQTYRNIEIIVVNDGSSDGGATERVALSYGEHIRYFSKPNGGVASALNHAISEMRGEYFSWLSHDDLYVPRKIERQISYLHGRSGSSDIVFSNCFTFTGDPGDCSPGQSVPPDNMPFRYWLTTDNGMHGCTLLIPRLAFDDCGVFDERLRTTQDYDLWFRMAGKYKFHGLEECLVKARHHPGQGTRTMKDLALGECNALLSKFVRMMTKDELLNGSGSTSLGLAYAALSENLMRRGFFASGRVAARLGMGALGNDRCYNQLAATALLARTHLLEHPLRQIRKRAGSFLHAFRQ